jgi:hypothetical protein
VRTAVGDREHALILRDQQNLFAVSAENLSAVCSQSVSLNSGRRQHNAFLKSLL